MYAKLIILFCTDSYPYCPTSDLLYAIAGMHLYAPYGTDGLSRLRKKDYDGSQQTGKGAADKDSNPRSLLLDEDRRSLLDRARAAFFTSCSAAAAGKGKEWGICPYRPPADQCLILRGHARRWNSRDPGLSVLYVSTEPVSSPLLLSRADTKDRTRAPDGVKAMHPPPYR